MNTMRRAAVLAASLALAFTAPLAAQVSDPFVGGDYVDVSSISVDDGHYLDYANYLAGQWRKQQDFAKSQGWISSYEVLANSHKRAGEPDIILVVRFKNFADGAEGDRRYKAFLDHMKATDVAMEAGSGERSKFRKVLGSQLWQELVWRK
ncbi:MAG: hypothetical protein ACREBO_08690 [Novosphingobium sp.]